MLDLKHSKLGAGALLEAVRIPMLQEVCVSNLSVNADEVVAACTFAHGARKLLVVRVFLFGSRSGASAENIKAAWGAAVKQLPGVATVQLS